jgi:hypothetical protein
MPKPAALELRQRAEQRDRRRRQLGQDLPALDDRLHDLHRLVGARSDAGDHHQLVEVVRRLPALVGVVGQEGDVLAAGEVRHVQQRNVVVEAVDAGHVAVGITDQLEVLRLELERVIGAGELLQAIGEILGPVELPECRAADFLRRLGHVEGLLGAHRPCRTPAWRAVRPCSSSSR